MKTFFELKMPLNQKLKIHERTFGKGDDMLTIIAGLHGDELDGLYICHRLINYLSALPEEVFKGSIRLIPAANPLGLDVSSRFWPVAGADINRSFPGDSKGRPTDRMADAIFKAACQSKYCIDIHSSNIFLEEIPQVRLNKEHFSLTSPAINFLGLEVVWVTPTSDVIESTLAYNLGEAGIPTFVIEAGIGLRITQDYCQRVLAGIIDFMHATGILVGDRIAEFDPPRLADVENVKFINSESSGIFIPHARIGSDTLAGSTLGFVIDPISGETKESVKAPHSGYLFTLRAHPIVYTGSLIGRIITPAADGTIHRLETSTS